MGYEALDPVNLLAQLETLQDGLWKYSWHKTGRTDTNMGQTRTLQRRIAEWRQEQISHIKKLRALMISETPHYTITATAIHTVLQPGNDHGEISQS